MILRVSPPPLLTGFCASPAASTTAKFTALSSITCTSSRFVSFFNFERRKGGDIFRISCVIKDGTESHLKGFSVLSKDVPWDVESTWSTFAAYFFILHIPLSFGVIPMIARLLHHSDHDPVITAASALILQATELAGFVALLYYTSNHRKKLPNFFLGISYSEQRNWLKAAALGTGLLILLVLLTSILADRLIGPKSFLLEEFFSS